MCRAGSSLDPLDDHPTRSDTRVPGQPHNSSRHSDVILLLLLPEEDSGLGKNLLLSWLHGQEGGAAGRDATGDWVNLMR